MISPQNFSRAIHATASTHPPSPTPTPPSPACPGEKNTGTFGTRCDHGEHGGVYQESVSNEEGDDVAPQVDGSKAPANREADGTESAPPMMGEMCGDGELRKMCSPGEECCNNSCGICAPKGHSCLLIACGALKLERGSKVAFAFRSRLLLSSVSL